MIKIFNNNIQLRLIGKTIDNEIQTNQQNVNEIYIEDCIFTENLLLRHNNINKLTLKNVRFEKEKSLNFEIAYSHI
jgi:hypothetical protein